MKPVYKAGKGNTVDFSWNASWFLFDENRINAILQKRKVNESGRKFKLINTFLI